MHSLVILSLHIQLTQRTIIYGSQCETRCAVDNKQLLDEVEHDMNYQNRGPCHRHEVLIIHDIMRKPSSEILRNRSEAFSHSVSEENTPRGMVTRQTLNLT